MQAFEDVDFCVGHKDNSTNQIDLFNSLREQMVMETSCSLLAGLSSFAAAVWDRKTGALIATITFPQEKSSSWKYISFLNSSELACGGLMVIIWNFKTNTQRTIRKLAVEYGIALTHRIISPKTDILIISKKNTIEVWNTATSKRLAQYEHETKSESVFIDCMIRVNKDLVALNCQPDVILYNYNTLQVHKVITKPELKKISQMSSSNGRLYIHTPQRLYRVGVEDDSLTTIANSQGYCFSLEVLNENFFVATKATGVYRIHYGKKTTIHEDAALLIGKVDNKLIMFQEQSNHVILFDPFTNEKLLELEGLPSMCVCPFTSY